MRRLAVLAMAVLAAACNDRGASAPPPEASDASPAALGPAPFQLVLGGALQGETGPCACPNEQLGGLARRATLVAQARAEGPTVHLDAGDSLGVQPTSPADPAAAGARLRRILAALGRMDVAALAVQPRDLVLGVDALTRAADEAGVPLVSANLRGPDGEPVFPPARRVEVAGQHLAVVGLSDPDGAGAFQRHGLSLAPPAEAVKAALAGLPPVDRIVVLGTLSPQGARRLAKAIPEVDLLLSAGTGRQASRAQALADARSWFLSVGDRGQHLMVLSLTPGEGPLVDADEARKRDEARRLQEARLARLETRLAQASEGERPSVERTLEGARRALMALPPALSGEARVRARLVPVAEDVAEDPAIAALVGESAGAACEGPDADATCE